MALPTATQLTTQQLTATWKSYLRDFVNYVAALSLSNLSDVLLDEPTSGQAIVYNGTKWVNTSVPGGGAGAGVFGYLDNTTSVNGYKTFITTPVIGTDTLLSASVTNSTTLISGFTYPSAQGRTQWDGGIWRPITFTAVSSTTGVSEIIIGMYNVQSFGGTVTITGTGTSRTCTVSGYTGTPFVSGDANADQTLAGYVQTDGGTFQITAFTSESVVTITTPTGYVNESGVSFTVHKYKFQGTTGEINNTGSTYSTTQRFVTTITQPTITLKDATDTIAARYYAKTTSGSAVTIYLAINGTTNNSYIETPFVAQHDNLSGLNKAGSDYQHLSNTEKTNLTAGFTGTGKIVRETSPTLVSPVYIDDATLLETPVTGAIEFSGTDYYVSI